MAEYKALPQGPDAGSWREGKFAGTKLSTVVAIVYFALCSSLLLVVNKVAIHAVPAPTFLLCVQLFTSVVIVLIGDRLGLLVADNLCWDKASKFVWVVVGFLGTLFSNMKVLQNANVETFITFRSSTPLVLSLCDWMWLGRAWPNMKSWLCLLVLLAGSAGYVAVDSGFKIDAYYWLIVWYAFFTFSTVVAKHTIDNVEMTNFGRVYYGNLLALLPLSLMLPSLGEQYVLAEVNWTADKIAIVSLSCVLGFCMSHASYMLQQSVSATYFTVVGIVCKILTVCINVVIWDKHTTPEGMGFLLICVLAGTFYQQAPKREAQVEVVGASSKGDGDGGMVQAPPDERAQEGSGTPKGKQQA